MAHGETAVSVSCCHLVENIITLCCFSSPCPLGSNLKGRGSRNGDREVINLFVHNVYRTPYC